jgi:hypothetical protein
MFWTKKQTREELIWAAVFAQLYTNPPENLKDSAPYEKVNYAEHWANDAVRIYQSTQSRKKREEQWEREKIKREIFNLKQQLK